MTKDRISLLLKAGANVILTTKGIDDLAMKQFVESKVMAVRRCKKADLKHIAKATGGMRCGTRSCAHASRRDLRTAICAGRVILSLADLEGNESVDMTAFGQAELVEEVRVGDGELIYVKGCKSTRSQTIVLRGANDYMLDEVERSLHDAMSIVKRTLESGQVVPGGGAIEAALSVYLESFADTMVCKLWCTHLFPAPLSIIFLL